MDENMIPDISDCDELTKRRQIKHELMEVVGQSNENIGSAR